MIITAQGPIPSHHLTQRTLVECDNAQSRQVATEWLLGNIVVKRDVHIELKQPLGIEGILGFGV